MGTTGEGAIVRALTGSTTENVIVDARCNILVVPSKAKFKGMDKVAIATGIENDDFVVIDEAVLFATHTRFRSFRR